MEFSRYRKPLILGNLVVSITLLLHIIGVYIFEGGSYVGLPGGSLSIGIVKNPINVMNPLQYSGDETEKLLYRFLFRSLIRYNTTEEIFEGDLGSCDLTNLAKVTCTLTKDAAWSDGTPIQGNDILASIEGYESYTTDEKMKEFLKTVSVTENKGTIILQSKSKNPLMADLLTYPILRSDMVEQIRTGRFSSGNYISSGLFTFGEVRTNAEYGFESVTLERNEKYSGKIAWLDKIHFRFFQDQSSLERGAETLSIIIPSKMNTALQISERFKNYTYTSYEYFGLFFHTDRLNRDFRNLLHWQLGTSFSGHIVPNHKKIENIFSTGPTILPGNIRGSVSDTLRKNGYLKREEILENIKNQPTIITDTGSITYDTVRFFTTKNQSSVLFVNDATGGVPLSGNIPNFTASVSINNYNLKEYIPGNTLYVYRVSTENGTLKEGKNTYTLNLRNVDNQTIFEETLTVYYSSDAIALEKYRDEVNKEYLARKNTPAMIADRERKKQDAIKALETLDEHYYYNTKSEPFTIKVAYITGPQSTEVYAFHVETILKKLGVKTELLMLEPKNLTEMINSGKKEYDILIVGVEAPGNIAKIGQIFLGSEAGKGINFANIQSKTLDDLFIELRSTNDAVKLAEVQGKIIELMQRESFFSPISSPYHTIAVDRNLKGIIQADIFPDISSIYDVTKYASIRDTYVLKTEGKGFFKFFSWLIHIPFS